MNSLNKHTLSSKLNLYYLVLIPVLIGLLPWFTHYHAQIVNSDIAFLTISAKYFLAGDKMSESFYDTNPPLSILIYVPAVLLSQIFGLTVKSALTAYFVTLIGLAAFLTDRILACFSSITTEQRFLTVAAFLVINTSITDYDVGQKDHILGLFLLPYLLLQLSITYKIDVNLMIKCIILSCFSFFIFLKPHYGLIIIAFFGHRIYIQRRFSIYKDIDFQLLTVFALLYVLLTYIYFFDFLTIILPDIILLYISEQSQSIAAITVIRAIYIVVPFSVYCTLVKKPNWMILFLFGMALLCLIPPLLQAKGFLYHIIPSNIFFYSSLALLAHHLLYSGFIQTGRFIPALSQNAAKTSLIVIILVLSYLPTQRLETQNTPPLVSDLAKSAFAKELEQCKTNCSFLILHDYINISHELSILTNKSHASRFPVMWFLRPTAKQEYMKEHNQDFALSDAEVEYTLAKYTAMIADDLDKHKPEIIFVAKPQKPETDQLINNPITLLDAREYLMQKNTKLAEELGRYRKLKTVEVNIAKLVAHTARKEYFAEYDVYRKIGN